TVLAFAHGVGIKVVEQSPFIKTESSYSGGEPLANAQALVFSPGDKETEFQRGRTDAYGFFVFIPDRAGDWRFEVDDEMGHRKEVVIPVTEAFLKGDDFGDQDDKTVVPAYIKIILGLSLIIGITGIFYGIKAKRILKSKK
ncbi:unnamed protein product, partial [marine sediment metagenome]